MNLPDLFATNTAVISPYERYRYSLHRIWDRNKRPALFIMLNPSTADAEEDDPTIRRCVGFARTWGMGGIVVKNLFAFRATKQADLLLATDPVGPNNEEITIPFDVALIVAAWGAAESGMVKRRADAVLESLADDRQLVYCLGETASGCPRHPLYLKGNTKPVLYR